MPSWIEFRLACRGILLLARFNPNFLRYFDRTPAGALRSFGLALLLLPYEVASAYLVAAQQNLPSMGFFLAGDVVGYLFGWILFPMTLLTLERALDREREVPGCIAVLNWYALLNVALQLPVLLAITLGLDAGLVDGLFYIGLVFSLAVEVFLLLKCLRVALWQAAILMIADLVISIALMQLVVALGRVPIPVVG